MKLASIVSFLTRFRWPIRLLALLLGVVLGLWTLAYFSSPRYQGDTLIGRITKDLREYGGNRADYQALDWVREMGETGVDELWRLVSLQETPLTLKYAEWTGKARFVSRLLPSWTAPSAKRTVSIMLLKQLIQDPVWTEAHAVGLFQRFAEYPEDWSGDRMDPTWLLFQAIEPARDRLPDEFQRRQVFQGLLESHFPAVQLEAAIEMARGDAFHAKAATILIEAIETPNRYHHAPRARDRALVALREMAPELAEKYPAPPPAAAPSGVGDQ